MVSAWMRVLLGVSGGLSLAVSGEMWGPSALAFVSAALMCAALSKGRPWVGGLIGWAAGSCANGFALGSVVGLLERFGKFPWIAAVPTAALCWIAQGLPYGLAAAAAAWLDRRKLVPLWLALPLTATIALSLFPMLFPWRPAVPLGAWPVLVQAAELGGAPLLDWALWQVGCATWMAATHPPTRRRSAGVAVAVALSLWGYGTWRLHAVQGQREQAPGVQFGAVQPNVGIYEKHDPKKAQAILKRLQQATLELEAGGAQLTIWPETAYPYPIPRSRMRDGRPGARFTMRPLGSQEPMIVGAVTFESQPKGPRQKWNSAQVVTGDGQVRGRVDKERLLWFGEVVPFWHALSVLQERFASPGFTAGQVSVLEAAGARVGVLICYEDLFASLSRRLVDQNADVLVNVTNNAWFGDTSASHLHDLAARLRAVEVRRDFVRVVNTGISSFVRSTGEVVERTQTFSEASFIAEVRLQDGTTPYAAVGDWVTPVCALAILGAWVRRRRA